MIIDGKEYESELLFPELEPLRSKMYACSRIGHFIGTDRRCHCCLQIIPREGDET